jgi:regulator of RNase E activity RraB
MKIPNDADGDAMRRVIEDGSDLNKPMDIDFMISCPSISAAEKIEAQVIQQGYKVQISQDSDDNSITCYCMKIMLLEYEKLIKIQEELDGIAKLHGGYIDGWGTFGNNG